MNLLAPIALISALASWAFLVMTFMNLLSGHFETRTCLTDCVKNYYFLSAALGLIGAGLASFSIIRSGFTIGQFFRGTVDRRERISGRVILPGDIEMGTKWTLIGCFQTGCFILERR